MHAGNMSPNNGTMIIFDEMTKDLTPHEVDERVEYWKRKHFANRSQLGVLPLTVCSCALLLVCYFALVRLAEILTNGSYSIERSCRAQKSDGSDSYITCEIVTDHSVSYTM